jgi:drug/metabolite transporter (DMT)-like permease
MRASAAAIAAALGTVYVIWGSTYLAIRFAIETLPSFLMAGVRFVVAGGLLFAVVAVRGTGRPTRREWAAATVVGALLLLGGNGGVVWAERTVPSGLTAVLVATTPFWMLLFDWLSGRGSRPGPTVWVALALGLAGVVLLVGPLDIASGDRIDPFGAALVLLAALSWAAGSLVSRYAKLPASALLGTAMEMLAGGALLLLAGAIVGEWRDFAPEAVSARSVGALVYLIVFGSLVGFTAYIWLLRASTPALVSTYAYVNPVVAVFLGWALAGETLSPRTLVAAAVIILAVALITTHQTRAALRTQHDRARAAEPVAADRATTTLSATPDREEVSR